MQVSVLLFGQLREIAGGEVLRIDIPAGASIRELLESFAARVPAAAALAGSLAVAVNQRYASPSQALCEGDEVALLPPVSGGSEEDLPESSYIRLQREPICRNAIIARIASGEDGALVVFDGLVRNNTRGRRTLFLDYEAYEPMAAAEMRSVAQNALKQFEVRSVAIVHRLGRLEIGETSVCIVVASAHRAAAFGACRYVIDTLKRTVPIWKKEHFEDGAIWADGEPFPSPISFA